MPKKRGSGRGKGEAVGAGETYAAGTDEVRMVVHEAAPGGAPPASSRGGHMAEAEDFDWADAIGPRLAGDGGNTRRFGFELDAEELGRRVLETIGRGGRLEAVSAAAGFPFEPRPQQEEMAIAVAGAVAGGGHLVAEAATGVGKSLAYLTPLVLHSLAEGVRVMVSTHTIALQEQLIKKDIPLLRDTLGLGFKAVLVKGRSNYLCRRRLGRAHKAQGELFPDGARLALDEIREWSRRTEDGSLQDLPRQPPADVWMAVCAETGNCLGQKCREFKKCFFQRARAQMNDANVLVVNHSLFFSDVAMQMAGGHGFLPPVSAVVLDEAHTVEDMATDYLGLHLSQGAFETWLKRLYVPETGKGLLGALRDGPAAHAAERLWRAVPKLFADIAAAADFLPADNQRALPRPLDVESDAVEAFLALESRLKTTLEGLKEDDPESWAELRGLAGRGAELRGGLEAWLEQRLGGHVYWLEREGRRRTMSLRSAPVEVGPALEEALWGAQRCVVLASATLAVGGGLGYVRRRLGVPEEARELCVGSPFDHRRQMRLALATDIPEPGRDKAGYEAGIARAALHCVKLTHGRAFVLFTSAETLRKTAEALRGPLAEAGIELLAQGEGLSRHAMLEAFRRADRPYALFGLDSFWMGVDVRGEALGNVVITRLPFAVPDHPVVEARVKAIQERGGNAFFEYTVPEAVLKFRQGVGRLIRCKTDTGMVAVLDSRLKNKAYGRTFLRSLPECPVGWLSVGEGPGQERVRWCDDDADDVG